MIGLALLSSASTTSADTFTLITAFDNTFDQTLTAPFVGTGSLSYDAVSALPNGSYDWTSFTNLSLQITFASFTFTQLDLNTPSSTVNVEIRDGRLISMSVRIFSPRSLTSKALDL